MDECMVMKKAFLGNKNVGNNRFLAESDQSISINIQGIFHEAVMKTVGGVNCPELKYTYYKLLLLCWGSRDNVVCIATSYGLDNKGV
jgi:hypothetical protein